MVHWNSWKVSQRAAVLLGRSDLERLEIDGHVRKAYTVRSNVAHGDSPKEALLVELPKVLRSHLRRIFIRLIVLGPTFAVDSECDAALLSAAALKKNIREPLARILGQLRDDSKI